MQEARFAAGLWHLFNEWRFDDRFAAARDHGFSAVELTLPYNLSTERLATTLHGHTWSIADVAWHPTEPILATAAADKTIRTWDLRRGEEIARYAHDEWPLRLDWSCDGSSLVFADRQHRVYV